MQRILLVLIAVAMSALFGCGSVHKKQGDHLKPPDYRVELEVAARHWDGEFNWSQARVVAIPGKGHDGKPRLLMTMQKWFVSHSDFYSGLYTIQSDDMGTTWTDPKEQPALGWRQGADSIIIGICDFTPGWHEETGKVLALGHTVYYVNGGKLLGKRPRSTAYAVYDPETDEWSDWEQLKLPDGNKFYNSGSGCGQWLVESNGLLLVPAYFKAKEDTTNCYASTILHCRFDGKKLTYIKHGEELTLNEPRGLYEPSLTYFNSRYYLTLRNDRKAYVTVSDDAMHWQTIRPWTFDDGLELGSYNTQQHWATHSEGLFLVYTRRDANNDHIPRSRAPLFMANVDPDRLMVQKESERILIPERGVMMGNFGVTNIDREETWVTVGENMHPPENLRMGADGSVFTARIKWSTPNNLARSSMTGSEELSWKAGTAKTVITPEKQVWLAGYGYKREPTGVLHDIWVKALALEDRNGHRSVIVTSDLMGIPRYMYEHISGKLMKRFHLERSQILLTFSHNHCAPRLHEDLVDYYPVDRTQSKLVKAYSDRLERQIIKTVARSIRTMSPARLSIGEGTAGFAVNRRNNPEQDVPELLASGTPLKGPVDHAVPVMAVYRAGDQLDAILFGYACHPTTLNFEKWCGDYPGFAQIALEKSHPGAMALFFTGGGADQNPLPRREVSLCEQYGIRLAEAVEKALQGQMKAVPSQLHTAFEFVDLDYLASPTRSELEEALRERERDKSARVRIRASWAGRMLEKMNSGDPFPSSYAYPVQVWKLGGMMHWISLGGEAVVDYSLRFKKEFGPNTWVCGYANVLVAYIPSLRVYNEGGYEGGAFLYEYGLPADRWSGDVEERVVSAVHRLVQKVE